MTTEVKRLIRCALIRAHASSATGTARNASSLIRGESPADSTTSSASRRRQRERSQTGFRQSRCSARYAPERLLRGPRNILKGPGRTRSQDAGSAARGTVGTRKRTIIQEQAVAAGSECERPCVKEEPEAKPAKPAKTVEKEDRAKRRQKKRPRQSKSPGSTRQERDQERQTKSPGQKTERKAEKKAPERKPQPSPRPRDRREAEESREKPRQEEPQPSQGRKA